MPSAFLYQAQKQGPSNTSTQTQTRAQQDADLEALKKDIGRPAFNGLAALAECRHEVTLEKARKSNNPNHRLAGLWLEVLNYADLQQQEQVSSLLPIIVAEDWDIETIAQAERVTRESIAELITIRKEYELPLVCSV